MTQYVMNSRTINYIDCTYLTALALKVKGEKVFNRKSKCM